MGTVKRKLIPGEPAKRGRPLGTKRLTPKGAVRAFLAPRPLIRYLMNEISCTGKDASLDVNEAPIVRDGFGCVTCTSELGAA